MKNKAIKLILCLLVIFLTLTGCRTRIIADPELADSVVLNTQDEDPASQDTPPDEMTPKTGD